MKAMLTGCLPLLLIVALLGCSEARKSKKPAASSDTQSNTDDRGEGGLLPEELAARLVGGGPTAPPDSGQGDGIIGLGEKLVMAAPKDWVRQRPRMAMIEHELSVPAAEGDQPSGRLTVMLAGGSIEDNIQRWIGQFTQPDGSKTAEKAKTEEKQIAGCKVHLVDIPGTYRESMGGGPFAPGKVVERPDYRMLAAIVETEAGNYFIKLYGPAKTLGAQADAFRAMIEGLKER